MHHVLAWWQYNADTDEDEIIAFVVVSGEIGPQPHDYTVLGSYATREEAERDARFYHWWMLEEVD